MVAHRAMGAVLFHIGELDPAHTHLEQALALYRPERDAHLAYVYGSDHAAITSCFLSLATWMRGEPDKALEIQTQAVEAARDLDHAHSVAQALTYLCMLHLLRRDPGAVTREMERLEELSNKHAFTFMTLTANVWRSWVKAYASPGPDTIKDLKRATDAWWASGAGNHKPFFMTLIAEVTLSMGDREGALTALAEAREHQRLTNEGWAQAETDRVYALAKSSTSPAEAEFRQALSRAQDQKARMFALHTAIDFARTCELFHCAAIANTALQAAAEAISGGDQTVEMRLARELLAGVETA
jgi:tetratricopeptide (TPR) repeat protein